MHAMLQAALPVPGMALGQTARFSAHDLDNLRELSSNERALLRDMLAGVPKGVPITVGGGLEQGSLLQSKGGMPVRLKVGTSDVRQIRSAKRM